MWSFVVQPLAVFLQHLQRRQYLRRGFGKLQCQLVYQTPVSCISLVVSKVCPASFQHQ